MNHLDLQNVDVVIAWYNENLEWLLTTHIIDNLFLIDFCVIYAKGPTDLEDKYKNRCKRYHRLPNLGRESHTFIHHIIENYDQLPKRLVCFQGNVSDHQHLLVAPIQDYLLKDSIIVGVNGNISGTELLNPIRHYGIWLEKIQDGRIEKSQYSCVADWIADIFGIQGIQLEQGYPVIFAANFGINKEWIQNISKEKWIKALHGLQHIDPENGHYQERSWAIIFLHSFISHLKKLE